MLSSPGPLPALILAAASPGEGFLRHGPAPAAWAMSAWAVAPAWAALAGVRGCGDSELWVLSWCRALERGHPRVLLAAVVRSRAGSVPWLGPGWGHGSAAESARRGGPGRGCRAGPGSGRLRRYIRAGAEAAVARRFHGNLHGDVVAGYQAGRRGPRGLRSPPGVPEPRHVSSASSLPSCPCPPVPPGPQGDVGSSHPCSSSLVSPRWGWPQHQPGGCPASVVAVSRQCGAQSRCRRAGAVASGWVPARTVAVP